MNVAHQEDFISILFLLLFKRARLAFANAQDQKQRRPLPWKTCQRWSSTFCPFVLSLLKTGKHNLPCKRTPRSSMWKSSSLCVKKQLRQRRRPPTISVARGTTSGSSSGRSNRAVTSQHKKTKKRARASGGGTLLHWLWVRNKVHQEQHNWKEFKESDKKLSLCYFSSVNQVHAACTSRGAPPVSFAPRHSESLETPL